MPVLNRFELAVVGAGALSFRSGPFTSAELAETFGLSNPLASGTEVIVLAAVIDADGRPWYQVGVALEGNVDPPVGWVAGGATSEAWLLRDDRSCPEPGPASIAALSAVGRLACYGSASLSFQAWQATEPAEGGLGGACEVPTGRPGWLVCDNINHNWVNADGGGDFELLLHFDPGIGIEPTGLADSGTRGTRFEIRGHFNDPASVDCSAGLEPASMKAQAAWLGCATKFVVEALTPRR